MFYNVFLKYGRENATETSKLYLEYFRRKLLFTLHFVFENGFMRWQY